MIQVNFITLKHKKFFFQTYLARSDENDNINYNNNDNDANNNKYNQNTNAENNSNLNYEIFQLDQLKNNKRRSTISSLFKYPTTIHTLTEPFYGTDHTIAGSGNELIFYYVISSDSINDGTRIQALHLSSARRITKLLNAATVVFLLKKIFLM